jgi:orotidine-5'-phosphate decarboxylase
MTTHPHPSADRLIVALDYPDAISALACVDSLAGLVCWYKVGLQLYLAAGPAIVAALKDRGHSVFLDLKLHDIPNTVAAAVRALAPVAPDLLTLHASGGEAMMRAGSEAASALPHPLRLLAVTVLTSMDTAALAQVGLRTDPAEQALRLGELAQRSSIPGLVCSPEEAAALRHAMPQMLLVTPGIRPAGAAAGDQRRLATPAAALTAGAAMLVVGRPITAAADPRAAAEEILAEMAGVLAPH